MATNETNGISLRRLKTFLTNLKNIFAEKSHSHATSDITGLDTALSSKATSAQGNKADTAVQSVKIGTTEYKSGTTVTLPFYPTSLPASDVPSWAKQKTKPTYSASEIGLGNVGNFKAVSTVESQRLTDTEKTNARANIGAQVAGSYASSNHNHDDKYQAKGNYASASHTHTKSQITDFPSSLPANGGNASTVNGHTVNSNVPANAKFTDTNTWIALKGATTSVTGTAGYAPAPAAGAANRYLRSDGTWSVPPDTNTTYPAATQSAQGLMSAADKKKLDGITSGSNTVMKLISSTDYSKLSDAQKKNGTVYFVI